ncbi:tRNA lysidine(34) synthetase TilS [Roseiconus lacunae]|uniref:tRNA(Ile)-lysidine synthase n=1 Tax=Roseiconus lacunae TaxID=2605694 RepID=A0ABT7PQV9_9BACT|nr:tRNA lysidine(34) synthetase TilS [Roseiconus lacunae]MDM4018897.1 tRNA lysidine(34) synthetase TilS [Roseiconus lacunae]
MPDATPRINDTTPSDPGGSLATVQWEQLLVQLEGRFPASRYADLGIVVGCSGGADSVALLRALMELRQRSNHQPAGFVVAAHFNHRLRGAASDADQAFVKQLAGQLGVAFDAGLGSGRRSDEQHARQERYRFFNDVMRRRGARYLLLGHHLEDNVETVLFRLMRGTGPTGLTGIAPFRELASSDDARDFVIVRPLLGTRRSLIREALQAKNYPWREDQSNQQSEYRRNWIRNELLPMMTGTFAEAIPSIGRAIEGQRGWGKVIEILVGRWIDVVVVSHAPLVVHRLDRLARQSEPIDPLLLDSSIVVESLRKSWQRSGFPLGMMNQTQWRRLLDLLYGEGPDRIHLPGEIEAVRSENVIRFRRPDSAASSG